MTRAIFLPVGHAEAADRIAELVERGVIKVMAHWLSREACQSFIDNLPAPQRDLYAPTATVIRIAGGAGRTAATLAIPTASMIERHDGVRVSGNTKGGRDVA